MRNMRVIEKSLPAKAHALLADRRRRNDSPWVFQISPIAISWQLGQLARSFAREGIVVFDR